MGIVGDFERHGETESAEAFSKQNSKLLKVRLDHGPIKAKRGSMVAYQGDVKFSHAGSGGLKKFFKQAATGEGVKLMDVEGTGEVFLADRATEVEVLYLQDDSLSVNGSNILAFSAALQWDVERVGSGVAGVVAGGLFNVTLRGTGHVAITSDGPPVVFDVSKGDVFADPQAVVCWTSGVKMDIKADVNLKALIGRGSGETFQMAFSGQGYVMVQPSEGVLFGTGGPPQETGGKGILGSLSG
ncbi:MAG: hypothetical protein KatS3mg008_0838 [Acidimicrobiales bacterium]|nr:MAG: hypothetical protein KatS3mg008_0838 [Acidimicrobiales bacterium]